MGHPNTVTLVWTQAFPRENFFYGFIPQTTDTQKELFFKNLELSGWNFLRHLGYFRPDYQHPFWYCESMFSIIQPLFLQKTKPLYLTPKYLFRSWIWIWAAKNLRFCLRVSVVRASSHRWLSLFEFVQIHHFWAAHHMFSRKTISNLRIFSNCLINYVNCFDFF